MDQARSAKKSSVARKYTRPTTRKTKAREYADSHLHPVKINHREGLPEKFHRGIDGRGSHYISQCFLREHLSRINDWRNKKQYLHSKGYDVSEITILHIQSRQPAAGTKRSNYTCDDRQRPIPYRGYRHGLLEVQQKKNENDETPSGSQTRLPGSMKLE